MNYISMAATAFLLTVAAVPLSIAVAKKLNIIDQPDPRKVHSQSKPRFGGMAIYLSFIITAFLFLPVTRTNMIILGTGSAMYLLGAMDDKFSLPAKVKFLVQTAAAVGVVVLGIRFNIFSGLEFVNPVLAIVLDSFMTIFWIVGIMNSVNLVDGLDGLASGLSMIACSFLLVVFYLNSGFQINSMLLFLISCNAAFLLFNSFPSKTFMGDGGSLFIGSMIALLSIESGIENGFVKLMVNIVIMAVPIFDTLIAMTRRYLRGIDVFAPDKEHFHHMVLAKGFSHRHSVVIIWSVGGAFGLLSILMSLLPIGLAVTFFAAAVGIISLSAVRLNMLDFSDWSLRRQMHSLKESVIKEPVAITKEDE